MVEELLQLLVSVVDAELLETVQVEDLKTRNVQNSDETKCEESGINVTVTAGRKPCSLSLGPIQRLVDPGADPLEESLVGRLADGLHSKFHLLLALSLSHVISSN